MSNTKIVIDKEVFNDMMYYLKMTDADISFKHTEIQIDQSIEARAETILSKYVPNREYPSYYHESNVIDAMQEYTTQQQIIEKLKVKEKERPFPCMSDEICKEQCGVCGYVQDKLTNQSNS